MDWLCSRWARGVVWGSLGVLDTHFWGPGGLRGPWIHDVRGLERGMGVILDVPLGLNGLAMQQVGEGGGGLGVFGGLGHPLLGSWGSLGPLDTRC